MKKRSLVVFSFTLVAWLCIVHTTQAQDITNAVQLALTFDQPGIAYPLALPYEPIGFQPMETLFVDFSTVTNALAAITNQAREVQNGISVWRMRLIQNAETGEVVVKAATNDVELLRIPAPSGFVPYATYSETLRMWALFFGDGYTSYSDLITYDGYTFLDPAKVVIDAWVISAADEDSYYSDGTTGGFTIMSEDGVGDSFGDIDPCSISNIFQTFRFTDIHLDATHNTILTWQACTNFIYGVFSTDVLTTNTFWAWRTYLFGQPNSNTWTDTTTTATNIVNRFYRVARKLPVAIAAGGQHGLVLRPDDTLLSFGYNGSGQLGDGDSALESQLLPVSVKLAGSPSCLGLPITNVVALAAGYDFSVALDASGTVWTFGNNEVGQLGNGSNYSSQLTPIPIAGVSNVVNVASGDGHTLALRADGTVVAWGYNISGQLGAGFTSTSNNTPIQSMNLTQIVAVAAGYLHSVALDVSGHVWTFGEGGSGQLGNGGTSSITTAAVVTGISSVVAIAAGGNHTIALKSDNTMWTFGDNSQGQLGRTGDPTLPGVVSGLNNVVAIAGGYKYTLAVTSNGLLYGFGDNSAGQLGVNPATVGSTNLPMLVAGITNVVLVSAPKDIPSHTLAVTIDQGTYRFWGMGTNDQGEVGIGTTTNQYVPAEIQPCASCIQLGTSNVFTAQCTGTLRLFFNDTGNDFGDNSNSYTVTISGSGLMTNVTVMANNMQGVPVGTVTNGVTYNCTASGFCIWSTACGTNCAVDADGRHADHTLADCVQANWTSKQCTAVCPQLQCFSLVAKIE